MNLVALVSMTLISHQAAAPAFYYDKAFDTPHLCQTDPAGNYTKGGKNYCAPTSAANALVYLARHGYPSLLQGDTMEDAYTLVRQLASSDFIGTEERDGTNDTAMILGISRYLQTCGINIKQFDYEGYRPLFGRLGGTDHATTVNLNWVKEKRRSQTPSCGCTWVTTRKHRPEPTSDTTDTTLTWSAMDRTAL